MAYVSDLLWVPLLCVEATSLGSPQSNLTAVDMPLLQTLKLKRIADPRKRARNYGHKKEDER